MLPFLVLVKDCHVYGWKTDGENRHCQQGALSRSSLLTEVQGLVEEATDEERAAQDQEEVAKDGSEQSALYDNDLVVPDPIHAQEHLNNIAKCCVQEPS
mmetsp:Transcript_112298/g.194625  ORF Transcript_112298/g.194625 Transcript_112298/m.194625 type:complete len:99 (+) Transcript_112298:732-1028(+)